MIFISILRDKLKRNKFAKTVSNLSIQEMSDSRHAFRDSNNFFYVFETFLGIF